MPRSRVGTCLREIKFPGGVRAHGNAFFGPRTVGSHLLNCADSVDPGGGNDPPTSRCGRFEGSRRLEPGGGFHQRPPICGGAINSLITKSKL